MTKKIEICAANFDSAVAAAVAGADRIELCSALDLGGLTPSAALIRQAVLLSELEVHVLIRPREGHFVYSAKEVDIMAEDIAFCRSLGAAGVVTGVLQSDHRLDVAALNTLKAAAGSMPVSCHRAFDFTPDPFEALETLIAAGFVRVLSSGQQADAYTGRFLLRRLIEAAQGRIAVMPGSGIRLDNIRAIAEETGASDFHFTAKKRVVPDAGDLPGLEAGFQVSHVDLIREMIAYVRS